MADHGWLPQTHRFFPPKARGQAYLHAEASETLHRAAAEKVRPAMEAIACLPELFRAFQAATGLDAALRARFGCESAGRRNMVGAGGRRARISDGISLLGKGRKSEVDRGLAASVLGQPRNMIRFQSPSPKPNPCPRSLAPPQPECWPGRWPTCSVSCCRRGLRPVAARGRIGGGRAHGSASRGRETSRRAFGGGVAGGREAVGGVRRALYLLDEAPRN